MLNIWENQSWVLLQGKHIFDEFSKKVFFWLNCIPLLTSVTYSVKTVIICRNKPIYRQWFRDKRMIRVADSSAGMMMDHTIIYLRMNTGELLLSKTMICSRNSLRDGTQNLRPLLPFWQQQRNFHHIFLHRLGGFCIALHGCHRSFDKQACSNSKTRNFGWFFDYW